MRKIFVFFFLFIIPLTSFAVQQRDTRKVEPREYQQGTLVDIKNDVTYGADVATFCVKLGGFIYDGRKIRSTVLQSDPRKHFIVNDTVDVRLDSQEKYMYLKKPDGNELRLKVVRKERVGPEKK